MWRRICPVVSQRAHACIRGRLQDHVLSRLVNNNRILLSCRKVTPLLFQRSHSSYLASSSLSALSGYFSPAQLKGLNDLHNIKVRLFHVAMCHTTRLNCKQISTTPTHHQHIQHIQHIPIVFHLVLHHHLLPHLKKCHF